MLSRQETHEKFVTLARQVNNLSDYFYNKTDTGSIAHAYALMEKIKAQRDLWERSHLAPFIQELLTLMDELINVNERPYAPIDDYDCFAMLLSYK